MTLTLAGTGSVFPVCVAPDVIPATGLDQSLSARPPDVVVTDRTRRDTRTPAGSPVAS